MAWPVCIDAPFLHLDAASVAEHVLRLSGPAPVAPPAGHTAGTDEWRGPYGTPVDQWTDVTHPPGGGLSYSYPPTPNASWLLDSEFPDGWYTIIERKV
jgi:hypothetical protein